MQALLPMTTHDLPWQPVPLMNVVVDAFEIFRNFYGAWAPRLPLLSRDYLIHP